MWLNVHHKVLFNTNPNPSKLDFSVLGVNGYDFTHGTIEAYENHYTWINQTLYSWSLDQSYPFWMMCQSHSQLYSLLFLITFWLEHQLVKKFHVTTHCSLHMAVYQCPLVSSNLKKKMGLPFLGVGCGVGLYSISGFGGLDKDASPKVHVHNSVRQKFLQMWNWILTNLKFCRIRYLFLIL